MAGRNGRKTPPGHAFDAANRIAVARGGDTGTEELRFAETVKVSRALRLRLSQERMERNRLLATCLTVRTSRRAS